MAILIIIVAVIAIIAFWIVSIFNKLVSKRQMLKEGWSGIDVQLKRRTDLIPNLIETVKGYMGHEKGVLEKVTELRAQSYNANAGGPAERGKTEGLLSGALANLFVVAENYPQLKADTNFQNLQKELTGIEEQVQLARRYYNGTVRDLNVIVESFPSNLIANNFGFKIADYFELESEVERAVPKVSF